MNAIEMLKEQHREVEDLFEQCEKAKGQAKQRLFEQIADRLALHATIEEAHFYPMTKSARTQDLLYEAVEEHLSVKRLIADLLEADVASPEFTAKMKVLQEQVEHHVKEEEEELFPKVEKLLSADQLEDLALVMEDSAREIEQGGSPRMNVPAETSAAAPIE